MLLSTRVCLILLCLLEINNTPADAAPVVDTLRPVDELLDFLSKYGYLQTDQGDTDQFLSDDIMPNAIRKFQKFTGLEPTGIPDTATLTKMKAPRCGLSDDISSFNDGNVPYHYTSAGRRWSKNSLKWNLTQTSAKLSGREQLSAMEAALDLWAQVTPLTFHQSTDKLDIEIKFVRGEHGDGFHNSFDGQGRVLAHAYGPGYGLGGDAHFDEDEAWTVGTGKGADLILIAAHELGHSLGLGHSSDPEALMAPFYKYSQNPSLKEDDIRGIQSLYGANARTPRPIVMATSSLPAITRTATSVPTKTATTLKTAITTASKRSKVLMPAFCDVSFRLDAICYGPDGFLYAFHDRSVYKLGAQGLESGYPKLISQVFPKGVRASVDAATYVPETKKTYLFTDFRVWRYTNFTLDANYPKMWTDVATHVPSAAMTLTYRGQSQILMFGNDFFWAWNPHTEKLEPGYPLAMKIYFPHAQQLPDAAFMNPQGHFIFLKGNSFKQLEHRGKDGDLKALGPNLFGSVCGGDPELLTQLVRGSSNSQPKKNRGNSDFFEPEFLRLIWSLVRPGAGNVQSAGRKRPLNLFGLKRL